MNKILHGAHDAKGNRLPTFISALAVYGTLGITYLDVVFKRKVKVLAQFQLYSSIIRCNI